MIKYRSLMRQFFLSLLTVVSVSLLCFATSDFLGYRTVALVLLLMVSALAMLFDILPVMVAAALSALTWNYFFIPPIYTFHIGSAEDALMFMMYFVIAMINAVLSYQIRSLQKKARETVEHEKNILLYNTLLNSLSHELRTPLATIIGSIDTIRDNEKISPESKNELYGEIEIAGLKLNRHVDNLLNMSRLEADVIKLNRDWCDMNETATKVIRDIKPDSGHQIVFTPREDLPLFKLDRGLVEQILHNIIHNAVVHTPVNTTVEIEIDQVGSTCRIVVSDDGFGFPEYELEAVFDKFYRLPQASAGGTGLGLSIVKGFVEAHGGTIVLSNRHRGGAAFNIELPSETLAL